MRRQLALACPSCGTANTAGRQVLRGVRRARSAARGRAPPDPAPSPRPSGGSSRCCSPTSSASRRSPRRRDPEEVRELLSRYFDTARQVIGRYGGTVEKFIGDAVMAVWGAPIAQEDDAERAVRAALDLVDAVAALGAEAGRARPGAAGRRR